MGAGKETKTEEEALKDETRPPQPMVDALPPTAAPPIKASPFPLAIESALKSAVLSRHDSILGLRDELLYLKTGKNLEEGQDDVSYLNHIRKFG